MHRRLGGGVIVELYPEAIDHRADLLVIAIGELGGRDPKLLCLVLDPRPVRIASGDVKDIVPTQAVVTGKHIP